MRILVPAILSASLWAQAPESRPTVAERSGFKQTSTHAEVLAFLDTVKGPRIVVRNFGKSGEGKPMPVAIVSNPPCDADGIVFDQRIRVLIVANIHGGEVEGKEAAQILLRECAAGQHDEWLKDLVLLVVPNFNPDGNDRIDKKNRVEQNGPDGGVGRRENAAGLDLNRDFVKLETPEGQALVALMNRFDPHALLDLHTTNGSFHGYHVTYATSQSPNVPAAVAKLANEQWIPGLVARLAKDHSQRAFPYGNLENSGGQQVWASFDHRPRFLTNYYGMRGRLALLCEAYSYLPFEERIAVTRAFVAEALQGLIALGDAVRKLAEVPRPERFGYASELEAGVAGEVLLGEVDRVKVEGIGTRLVAKDVAKPTSMRVRANFESKQHFVMPGGYAIVAPSAATTLTLLRHGLHVGTVEKTREVMIETFIPTDMQKASRSFQKHLTLEYRGRFEKRTWSPPLGTIFLPDVNVLVAQLLDPLSEDSLGTWNHFEAESRIVAVGETNAELAFPVVRSAEVWSDRSDEIRRVWSSALTPSGSEFAALRPVLARLDLRAGADPGLSWEHGMTASWSKFAAVWKGEVAHAQLQLMDLATGKPIPGGVEVRWPAGVGPERIDQVRRICEELGSPVVRIIRER